LWWSLRDQHKQTRKSRRRRKGSDYITVLVSIDLISVGSSDDNSFLSRVDVKTGIKSEELQNVDFRCDYLRTAHWKVQCH